MFGTYRILLALMVVLLHLGGIPYIGAYAVFGFYILSGYLMTFIMHKNYGYSISGMSKYALNRFLRVYPTYWASIVFSLLIIILVGESFTRDYHSAIYLPSSITDWANNIFLFFPDMEEPRLTPPAWALTVEIFFYICIGLGLSKNKKVTLIWLCLSMAYHIAAMLLNWSWEYRYFAIPAASLPFAMGAIIYHYKDNLNSLFKKTIYKVEMVEHLLPLILFGLILANWGGAYFINKMDGWPFYSNFLLNTLLIIVLTNRKQLPFISRSFDKRMGDFSYPIYLIHYQVGLVVIIIFGVLGLSMERPSILLMCVSLPFIFLASWLIIKSIEEPIEQVRAKVRQVTKNLSR